MRQARGTEPELYDSYGNPVRVGDTVRLTARRGGTTRYADRQITRSVLQLRAGKLLIHDSEGRERLVSPRDVTRVGDDGQLMIHW